MVPRCGRFRNLYKLGVFVKFLLMIFGDSAYDDPMEVLQKLRQSGSVAEYKSQFEALSNRLRDVSDRTKLSCFSGGLKDEIRYPIKLLGPINLQQAFGMAKIQEEYVAVKKRSWRSFGQLTNATSNHYNAGALCSSKLVNKTLVPIQKITPTQMKERRDKGLCYNCDDKWHPGHKCKSTKLFLMEPQLLVEECVDSDSDDAVQTGGNEMQYAMEDEVELAQISMHAILGTPNIQTMRCMCKFKNAGVVILIDTGSTHNFIDPSVVS